MIADGPCRSSIRTRPNMRQYDGLDAPDLQMGLCMGLLPDREGFTVTVRQGRPAGRGTVRLRSTDPASVVDPRLRVRGVDGLRAIDASVMPTHMDGNTNAPTIMVAEKGAAMVLDDW